MMKLSKLIIQNFLSIQKATINLLDRGLVSVEGYNLDPDGANSNGSGKSSLINAIMWCNYDDPGKKLKSVDDVVNTKAGSDCIVQCVWYDEETEVEYIVTRYRKHSIYKNAVVVQRIDSFGSTDLSKGTNDESQKVINQILGADKATFEAYCFAKQDDAPDIPGMSDGQLKSLLERVLPLDELGPLYKIAQDNYNKQLSLVNELTSDQIVLTAKIDDMINLAQEARERVKGWSAEIERKVEENKLKIVDLRVKVHDLKSKLKPKEKIDAALNKFQKLIEEFDENSYRTYQTELRIATSEFFKASSRYKDLPEDCPSCHRKYDNYEQSRELAKENLYEAQKSLDKANKDRSLWDLKVEERKTNIANLEKVKALTLEQSGLEAQIRVLEGDIARLDPEAISTENPHEEALKRLLERLKDMTIERRNVEAQLENEKARLPILEAVAETYSPKGVRYHILDSLTPELNERTNYYLSQLTDGAMQAIWSTVTKLKSGEFKERFSIEVKGKNFNSYGSLSGGEKRKVKLACFLGLQDIIAKRATKSIDLWCADEIDHALDPAGLERLMNLLHEKTATKSTILVISHNELREWIPNYTTVVKQDGISTIKGFLSDE